MVHRTRRPAQSEFGIGVGTLVLAVNVVLLGSYTFGCHSLRHLVGGLQGRGLEVAGAATGCYDCVELPQRPAQLLAWCSLFSVGFADVYVRLCSMGIWTDLRIL